jgi:hypothetical protein
LSSISKTAKWGRLGVRMNYCTCILLFFCISTPFIDFYFQLVWSKQNFISQLWEPKLL